eukprot:Partr_v1_DN27984_c1_g1_i1_m11187 putative retrotransposon Tto1 - Nicotiana tabacumSimilarity to retrotransposon Tto1 -Nicotiana tabacumSimilarity to reverse transcriptase pol - Volvox carteri
MLGDYPVAWKSKLQPTTASSSMEAEIIAVGAAQHEALWLRKFLESIGIKLSEPTIIKEDNEGCIKFAYGTAASTRARHIDTKYYAVCDSIQDNKIKVEYLATEDMTADMLTKPLAPTKFAKHREGLNMGETHA